MTKQPGDIVGGYRLAEKVGSGAEGSVWKAVHQQDENRAAAIKFAAGGDESFKAIEHPNLVRIEDQGDSEGSPYLRMEWIEGETLRKRLARETRLSSDKVRAFALQIVRALAHLHERKIIHGDLKPSNILITPDEVIKVTDFGLRPPVPDIEVSTKAGDEIIGTVGYLAPELKKGEAPDQKSDLYALGAVIHEMLTGELPPGHLDPEWDRVVSTLLTDRDHRLDSAGKVLEILSGDAVPKEKPWHLESWVAGPMTVLGIFFIAYLCMGMQMLQPVLRILLLLPGLALVFFFARGIRAPGPTALFWGGLFWAYASRGLHIGLAAGGIVIAAAGAAWYLVKIRKTG